ncbi:MAG: helix-turn-helix domain-containing protein [Oscillospiraceae bacterium]|nr:helix-turn-helix domain-containing protein [Oscillospiraceae bacterium]
MDWLSGMQKAINYIEDNITEDFDCEEIARQAFSSSYHFQRVFSILCGYSLGEYIRNRRLSLAGTELMTTNEKIIDIAIKYGYDSPDGFTKAFTRFHSVAPSSARKEKTALKSFSRLSIKLSLEGGSIMDYKVKKELAFDLVGYKRKFNGGFDERFDQESDFWVNTRAEQEVLTKLRNTQENIWYDVNCNFSDNGYDHYICVATNNNAPDGFEKIHIPEQLYVIVQTERAKYPTVLLPELRKRIVSEWLPSSGYILTEGYEIAVAHWYPIGTENKYIEVWIPIKKSD